MKYRVIENQQELARINRVTKQIEVSPDFYSLSEEIKDFVMFVLKYLDKNNTQDTADELALREAMGKYPNRSKMYFIKELCKVFRDERPDIFSLTRIEKLIKSNVGSIITSGYRTAEDNEKIIAAGKKLPSPHNQPSKHK